MTGHQKDCFGVLNKIFPMGDQGLREIVPSCFDCHDRIGCLKAALNTDQGLEFRSGIINRSPGRGLVARLKRWSEKKDLNMRLKKTRGNAKWL